jgi:hypothetical protein
MTNLHRVSPSLVLLAACAGTCDGSDVQTAPPAAADPTVVFEREGTFDDNVQQIGNMRLQFFDVTVPGNESYVVTVSSSAFDPVLQVTPPGAAPLTNDDWQGSREHAQLAVAVAAGGVLKVGVTSFEPRARGRYRVLVRRADPNAATPVAPAVIGIGQTHAGEIAADDAQLRDGRHFEQVLVSAGGQTAELEVRATGAVTPMVLVLTPAGRQVAPGANGNWILVEPGVHRVQVMSPAAGQLGGYTLSLRSADATAQPTLARAHHQLPAVGLPTAGAIAVGAIQNGELADSDQSLPSGEKADVYDLAVASPSQEVTIELESGTFDPYLMLIGPGGRYWENDDDAGLNAALRLTVPSAGAYRVVVTSYQSHMRGPYQLKVSSGARTVAVAPPSPSPTPTPTPTPTSGSETRGTLAAGDQTLDSGEFADYHSMRFEAGESVSLRLTSSAFDPYLIVRTPSGQQNDNDDIGPNDLSSGIDIPVAEAGEYTVIVTSYQPGETGAYALTRSRGAAVPRPGGEGGGGRVFGVFAGISDYPPGQSDLPECANDAVKLAEALRNQGLLSTDRQVLLTDAQATMANVRAAMTRMAGQVGPDDVFVFFWSGHGGQRGGSSDSREIDGTDETLVLYDGEIVDDEVGRLFDGIRARISLAAIDACYSGGFAKDLVTRPGRVGMFSSEEDVLSAVASQFQAGGYLSHFLRGGVAGAADTDPADRVLTVGELTHHLYTQFGAHVRDVHLASAYQHLVIDRGAVGVDQVLWAYR